MEFRKFRWLFINLYKEDRGRIVIAIFGSLIWSKTLMELIFNPCGEFRWSTEGPVSKIHSPHFHAGAPGIFSDLLRSVQILERERERERESGVRKTTGSYRTYLSLVELQLWFLSLQWKTSLGQNCILGTCICSERPALGQITLIILILSVWLWPNHSRMNRFSLNTICNMS